MRTTTGWILCALSLVAGCGEDSNPPPEPPPPAASTYSVGGNVSGLSGSVTLANNGGDARAVTASGAFTFATSLANGAAYNVTITSQPATQTCSVTGGAGTVAAANVSTIAVSCVTNTVTIGGTVSGLVSPGLVLQNNGGDNLTLAADGTFAFATPIAAGTNYNVTVLTQPAGQLCTPGTPTGTANANVTNIAVSCQGLIHSIGGTVAGVRGDAITLQVNGGNNVRLNSDGAFTFGQGIAHGSPYDVTILTQPSGPNQVCAVSNGTGTITGPVTNVMVTCPVPPSFTQMPASVTVVMPTAATFTVTATGIPTPAIQWQASVDGGATWANIAGATSSLYTTPATTLADHGKRFRAVATSASGTATSPFAVLSVSAPPSGKTWRAPVLISEPTGAYLSLGLQIDVNARGDAIVAWQQAESSGNVVWANIFTVGVGWRGAARVGNDARVNAVDPQVAIDNNGNAVVVWVARTEVNPGDSRNDIRSNYFSAGGGWGVSTLVETDDGLSSPWHDAVAPRVTIADTGVALVVWDQWNGSRGDTHSVMYSTGAANAWGPVAVIATNNANFPALSGNAAGQAAVAWAQLDGTQFHIQAARYDGNRWSAAELIDRDTTSDSAYAGIGISANGDIVAVWRSLLEFKLMGARNINGAWQPERRLSSEFAMVTGNTEPLVVMDAAGNAVVQWQGQQVFGSGGDYLASLTNGTWSPGVMALSSDGTDLHIAMNSSGQTMSTYASNSPPFHVRASTEYTLDPLASVALSPNAGGPSKIAIDDDGEAIAIWVEPDGVSSIRVWASEYR